MLLPELLIFSILIILPSPIYCLDNSEEEKNPVFYGCDQSVVEDVRKELESVQLTNKNLYFYIKDIDHKISQTSGDNFKQILNDFVKEQRNSFSFGITPDNLRAIFEAINQNLKVLNQSYVNSSNKLDLLKKQYDEQIKTIVTQSEDNLKKTQNSENLKNELGKLFQELHNNFSAEMLSQIVKLETSAMELAKVLPYQIKEEVNKSFVKTIEERNGALIEIMKGHMNQSFQKQRDELMKEMTNQVNEYKKEISTICKPSVEITESLKQAITEAVKKAIKEQNLECGSKMKNDYEDFDKNVNLKYLDPAAKTPGLCNPGNKLPQNCAEALKNNQSCKDGIYLLHVPGFKLEPFYAFCMQDPQNANAPAWTLIQKRSSNIINFYRNWEDYKNGFGDLKTNFWLGLERIHAMTITQKYELWIMLTDNEGAVRSAKFNEFIVGSEKEKYPLSVVGKFTGDVADSFSYHSGQKFTTKDSDNDDRGYGNCAEHFKGGWWYADCHVSNLNGMYNATKYGEGINWKGWHGYGYSLKYVHMAIRPLK